MVEHNEMAPNVATVIAISVAQVGPHTLGVMNRLEIDATRLASPMARKTKMKVITFSALKHYTVWCVRKKYVCCCGGLVRRVWGLALALNLAHGAEVVPQ